MLLAEAGAERTLVEAGPEGALLTKMTLPSPRGRITQSWWAPEGRQGRGTALAILADKALLSVFPRPEEGGASTSRAVALVAVVRAEMQTAQAAQVRHAALQGLAVAARLGILQTAGTEPGARQTAGVAVASASQAAARVEVGPLAAPAVPGGQAARAE